MIIGIVGTIGSGKGTVVAYLKQHEFVHYSASGILTEMLEHRGEQVDRDAMGRIAREIRADDPDGMGKVLIERYQKDHPEKAIVEALHSIGEVEYVKRHGGVVIGVDASVDVRYERIRKRGSVKDDVTYEKFVEQARREDDGGTDASGHNIRGAIAHADYTLVNNGTLEELHTQIDAVLEKIGTTLHSV
jgi:dephospho-CoA kinase